MLVAVLFLLTPSIATAQTVDLTARSVYHGYQLRLDPLGGLRRRHLLYAAVQGGAFGLGPERQFDLVASFRYDTDFGRGFTLDTPLEGGPGRLHQHDVDLMVLYVDWRDMIGREFDLRVGRQFQTDDLDWFVFDGLKLMGHLWRDGVNHFDLDLYAGVPGRFDTLFSSSDNLVGDGTELYDGEDPYGGIALGASVYLRALRHLSLSLSWRNELMFRETDLVGFGPTVEVQPPYDLVPGAAAEREAAAIVSSESVGLNVSLLGGGLGYMIAPLRLRLEGHAVVDLARLDLDRARVAVSWDPGRNLHLGVELMRIRPRFLGDSIFNWFNQFPNDRLRAEASWTVLERRLRFALDYLLQDFDDDDAAPGAAAYPVSDEVHGPGGSVAWRTPNYGLELRVEATTSFGEGLAYGGDYILGIFSGDVQLLRNRLRLDGRVSLASLRPQLQTSFQNADGSVARRTTVSAALAATGHITDWISARALYVQNFDPILEGNYRLQTELAVRYR